MKKYGPQILIAVLLLTNLWQCHNNRGTSKAIQRIDQNLAKSVTRMEMFESNFKAKEEEHKVISRDSFKINEKHEKIRNNIITDPVRDSLARSINERGQKRFD
tara:strand:+ start:3023 stop:3331 length:309 start_codon:yes stop_codon:yes gene_type:complete